MVDGDTCFAIPDDRRLALVGNTDGLDLRGGNAGFGERFTCGGELDAPDLLGVVFDPAGLGVDLLQLNWAIATVWPASSNTMLRELEVPWSSARM